MNIVFLGDSLTNGNYGGNWVSLVAQHFRQHTIINAGVGGDTVVNLRQRVDDLLQQYQIDVLFVMVGGNDAVSYLMPATRPYYKSAKGIPDGTVTPDLFATTYRELLTQVQLYHVQTVVGLPPTEYNAELVAMRHHYNKLTKTICDALNIPTLDLATPFIPPNPIQREAVNLGFIQDIGKRMASGWNDYEAERQKWGYTYTFDGMHLLPSSAEKMARLVITFLKEALLSN
jgi:lysophospholipase L1-like esterase